MLTAGSNTKREVDIRPGMYISLVSLSSSSSVATAAASGCTCCRADRGRKAGSWASFCNELAKSADGRRGCEDDAVVTGWLAVVSSVLETGGVVISNPTSGGRIEQ